MPKVPKEQAPKEKPTTPAAPQRPDVVLEDPRRDPEYRSRKPAPDDKTR